VLETFRKTFYLVGRDKPARWVVVIVGALAASGLEMVGALLIFLLLALIADPGGELELPLVGDIRGYFAGVDETTFLLATAVVIGVFFLVRVVVQAGFMYVRQRMAHNASARLSSRLAEGYLRLPYAFHLRRSSSELVRNAHQTIEALGNQCFLPAIHVIAEGLLVLGLALLMLVIAPGPTAMAAVIIGGAALLLLKVVQPRLKSLGGTAQEMRKRSLGALQQALHGIRDIKVLGGEAHFGRRYHQDRRRLARALYLRGTVEQMPRHVIETTLVGFILVLFGTSVALGMTTGELLSTLGLFAYAGLRIMPSLQKVVSGLNNLKFSAAAVDQVHADLELVEQVERAPAGAEDPLPFERELRLEGVSYAYEQTEHPAVTGVDLTITPGEVIGICGPTGGGKTTLADLITGILPATSGAVTVDGIDIQERIPGWFAKLGVVPQMVFLVDDTLRRNVALAVDDEKVDEVAVEEAIRLAQLEDVVANLPQGLDTEVGERGVRLSGGQRQRVAIARALYRRPEVLIFDEGTSALDNTTESVLISSLERLRGTHTILLIAHRLSTVRNADRIVYLENGRIAGLGTFEELRAQSEGFRSLAQYG
jgi:ATP-binding cassette, subfamily B, bacterial PglK